MKKLQIALIALVLLGGAGVSFASTVQQYAFPIVTDAGPDTAVLDADPTVPNSGYLIGTDPMNNNLVKLAPGTGLTASSNTLIVDNVPQSHITGLSTSFSNLTSSVNSVRVNLASATTTLALWQSVVQDFLDNETGHSTDAIASTSNPLIVAGFMLTSDKIKLDSLNKVQNATVTTDSNGNATWTYPTAYATAPRVNATVEDATSGANTNVQIVSKTATSTTVHANRITSALGLLSLTSNPSGLVVDLMATQ